MSDPAKVIIDLAIRHIAASNSRLAFEQVGSGGWPVWNRFLSIDGKRAYYLGNVCGTCGFLFERMEGATSIADVGKLTDCLAAGIERLDETVVDSLALLMPKSVYHVALMQLVPKAVLLGSGGDYFFAEQIENENGPDPFWGVPHYAKVPYYRTGEGVMMPCRGRSDGKNGVLFQFIVPMFPESGLDRARTLFYKERIVSGATPTAVAISILDVKGPATGGIDHWCFAHYLIDGHHKVAAAARCGRPVTLLTFLSADQSIASQEDIETALTHLCIAV